MEEVDSADSVEVEKEGESDEGSGKIEETEEKLEEKQRVPPSLSLSDVLVDGGDNSINVSPGRGLAPTGSWHSERSHDTAEDIASTIRLNKASEFEQKQTANATFLVQVG